MMKHLCTAMLGLLLVGSGACISSYGLTRDSMFRTRYTSYKVGELPTEWRRVALRGADLAYLHEAYGTTLLINSKCENAEDAPLNALTFHLLIGMTDQKIIEQKPRASSEREGLETTAEAKLDGVKRKMRIFVLKKDMCIYDVVLSARPSKFEEALSVYEAMMAGFDVPGKKQ